jgi:hypothetical protein
MEIQTPPASIKHETWIMHFDDSIMKEGAGVGLVFISPLGVQGVLGTTTFSGIEQRRRV